MAFTPGLPVILNLDGVPSLVVGGGVVGTRRAIALQRSGSNVCVVSPEVSQELSDLASQSLIELRLRKFEPTDIEGMQFVVASTNDPDVNSTVTKLALQCSILVNDAEDSGRGNCLIPMSFQRGRLQMSVTTNGASPAIAKSILENIDREHPEYFATYLDLLFEAREKVRMNEPDIKLRTELMRRLAADGSILELVHAGDLVAAKQKVEQCISSS
ncbi:MAG: bifunctional precorrin-2 dehydrogenase/sirohydrochlorin ferrochelatase [Chthonomonadales bacterium]